VKYLPLVWAALRRHPAESLLTFLVLTVAFTLFGSMVGLKIAYDDVLNGIRMDRLLVTDRFCCPGLPIAMREQLAKIPGVRGAGLMRILFGYHQEPDNFVGITVVDEATVRTLTEFRLTEEHWRELEATPTGLFFSRTEAANWNVKRGDTFTLSNHQSVREDGATVWSFTVLGVVEDPSPFFDWTPRIYGNYHYADASRTPDRRGRVNYMLAAERPDEAVKICGIVDRTYANSDSPTYCVPLRQDATMLMNSVLGMRQMSLGIAAAGLFMILFLCANGVADSVRERLHEFAVLKTLGFSDREMSAVVFLEAALPVLAGAASGLGLAAMFGSQLSRFGPEGTFGIPEPAISPLVVALAVVAALLIAAASSVLPLRRLKTMQIATVLAGR
jgi:putative ABC transport system permease protein